MSIIIRNLQVGLYLLARLLRSGVPPENAADSTAAPATHQQVTESSTIYVSADARISADPAANALLRTVSPQTTLYALQEWQGCFPKVAGDEFVARLVDRTAASSHEEEEAIIPLAEPAYDDVVAFAPGGNSSLESRLRA